MEKLVCNKCGITYTDSESIEMAKKRVALWRAILKRDNIEATGIAPCPIMSCKGELQLKNE